MAEQIKVPGVLRPGTGDYHSYAKDIIDDQLRNKKQSELNALFNQGKGIDKNGNIVPVAGGGAIDADDISYTEKVSPDSHKTGSVGKKVKELEDRINDLVPGEEYVSDTVIDLIDYMLDGSTPQSFTYDSDTKYVYSGKVTTMCTYARNNTSYAAFKVVDIDKYIVYTIYDNTFTYYNELNSETLPNEARSKFELGKYALVKQLEGKTGDSWVDGKVGVFVDSSNRPMSFRYVSSVEIYGQTLNNVLLGKTTDGTNIYVYILSSGMFKFNNRISPNDSAFDALNNLIVGASGGDITGAAVNGSTVPKNGTILQFPAYPTSGTMSYSDSTNYDAGSIGKAVKDAKVAANVSFDDSLTHLSTQGSPITNVQEAIQKLATKVYGDSSKLIITLIYSNGNYVANKWFDISSTFQGSDYDFSSQLNDTDNAQYVTTVDGVKKFKTNSNGECRIGLPIGATYNIEFDNIANFAKPNDISGIADSAICNISASYTALSRSETVLIKVLMVNVSSSINPNNKKVYIDLYDNNNEIDVSKYYEITVNSAGLVSTVKRKNDNSDTYTTVSDNNIDINQGKRYKVYLEDWEGYNAEATSIITSQNVNRIVVLKYTYLLSGMYILLNDIYNPLGYESCKVLDIDTTNNKIKIVKNVNGTEGNYWIYHKSNNGIYMYGEYEDTSSEIELISEQSINTIFAGVGLRNQELNHASLSQNSISGTCAFFITSNVTTSSTNPPHPRYINDSYDGQGNCDSLVGLDAPSYPVYDTVHSKTCTLGNNTYNAFLPSDRQFIQIIANYDSLSSIFSIFGKNMFSIKTGNWAISTYAEKDYIRYYKNGSSARDTYYASPSCNFLPIFSF